MLDAWLQGRHSCRAFLREAVPRPAIERLLQLAQRNPSWCNTQPWLVHLVSGEPLERLARAYVDHAATHEPKADLGIPTAYVGVYDARRRECGYSLYQSLGIERSDAERRRQQLLENYRFFGAPHLAVITTDRALGTYGAVDCGGYINCFLLAAHTLGIAAVPQAAVAMHSDFLRRFLALPDDRLVVAGIAFGRADTQHAVNSFRTTRAELEETVTWVGSPAA
nr:nitroreductase [Variovorax paradoxus]